MLYQLKSFFKFSEIILSLNNLPSSMMAKFLILFKLYFYGDNFIDLLDLLWMEFILWMEFCYAPKNLS